MSTPAPRILQRPGLPDIAYHKLDGSGPTVVFLHGLRSDMEGTKALALEAHCRTRGHAFLRFDCSGHGQSGGEFTDGTIGQWAVDALAVIDAATEGPLILVGSSMGGWIALLVALARKERMAGFIGLAAAPDFTEDLMWATYSEAIRKEIVEQGIYMEPSDYGDPLPVTRLLIEEGRNYLLLRGAIELECPIRLIQGMRDADVPPETALRIMECVDSTDVDVTLVKDGDHRLSEPRDLARLTDCLDNLLDQFKT